MTDLIINKYYQSDSQLHYILVEHGKAVKGMAHEVLAKHPELDVDVQFIEETAMLRITSYNVCYTKLLRYVSTVLINRGLWLK